MGAMKDGWIEISNWLNSDRSYEDGVYLYLKYGRNEQLKRLFPGRKNRYAEKLAYELGKLIGIVGNVPIEKKEEDAIPQASKPVQLKKLQEGVVGINYPPVIGRVVAELSRLFNERAMLKKQVNAVPDENTPENIAKRKELNESIGAYSARMEILFQAKRNYLERGVLPEESALWENPEKMDKVSESLVEEDLQKLINRRNSLRSALTRAKNTLEYGTSTKGKKRSPMPECEKRKKVEERILQIEAELLEIETKINDVGDSGSAPATEGRES